MVKALFLFFQVVPFPGILLTNLGQYDSANLKGGDMTNFTIERADNEYLLLVPENWRVHASPAELGKLELALTQTNAEWFLIKEGGEVFGLFSMIPVPLQRAVHYKNMHQFFFRPSKEGDEEIPFEDLERNLQKIVDALATSFIFMLDHANSSQNKCCKIYNDIPEHKFWYIKFAEYLQGNYPDQYAVKFYGNWVEITQKPSQEAVCSRNSNC